MKTYIDAAADINRRFGLASRLHRQTLNGATMGTRYSAVFYAPPDLQTPALAADLFAAVDRVDLQMSTWKPDSDLNQLNDAAAGAWVALPKELMAVLTRALQIERVTNGAFDIGVGGAVREWGFGPGGAAARTGSSASSPIKSQGRPVTHQALHLDPAQGRARKDAALSLDLSGIAKGFAVDEMAAVMDAHAISSWLVGIDGEMRGKGLKPDNAAWAIAHERPDRFVRDAMGVIELTDMAVATSGNYRHWREIDGAIISHTINPQTDVPLANSLVSVSVLAPTCMTADAWATAYMVLGADAGLATAKRLAMDVIFVTDSGAVISTL